MHRNPLQLFFKAYDRVLAYHLQHNVTQSCRLLAVHNIAPLRRSSSAENPIKSQKSDSQLSSVTASTHVLLTLCAAKLRDVSHEGLVIAPAIVLVVCEQGTPRSDQSGGQGDCKGYCNGQADQKAQGTSAGQSHGWCGRGNGKLGKCKLREGFSRELVSWLEEMEVQIWRWGFVVGGWDFIPQLMGA